MLRRWFIATGLVAVLVSAANAQPRGRAALGDFFGGRSRLLIDLPEVRNELGVSDQQSEWLDALQEDLEEQRLAIREEDEGPHSADETVERIRLEHLRQKLQNFDRRSEALVSVILEPNQASRLSELYLQREGLRAFERPEVATKLELSDEQKQRLQTLRETLVENRPRRGDREKEQQALRELLSEEQQARWQQLLGKPFNFSTPPRRGLRNR